MDSAGVFPTAKIKAILQEEDQLGALPKKAVDLLGACSAVFIRRLYQTAATTRTALLPNAPVSLADLRRVIEQDEAFQFLEGVLDDLQKKQTTSNRSSHKRRERPVSMTAPKSTGKPAKRRKGGAQDANEQEALKISESLSNQVEVSAAPIVPDDEDYDD